MRPAPDASPGRDELDPDAALLRMLVDQLPGMVAYWDENQRCRFANRDYERWFGVRPEALIGKHMSELLGPIYPLNLPFIEGALRGEEQEFEREIPDPARGPARHSQAHYIPHIVDGKVRGFSVLVVDVTRRKNAEVALQEMGRQLQAAERLAAMATLAAGIAHEINNPLTSVLANIELALESLQEGGSAPDALRASLLEARDGTKRVRDIVQSMKLLARGDTTRRELVDVNDTLERSLDYASNALRYRARLVRDLAQTAYVDANASQLAQVLVNLLLNAAQAFPEEHSQDHEIRVSTGRDGDQIVIEVADNGRGIPDELLSRIFEPFFTTREVGGGMGLGLSISNGIVKAFGGTLSVLSKVGQGSVFRVTLPAASERVPPPTVTSRADSHASVRPPVTRPRVLVVDDEVALTRTLDRILAPTCDVVVMNHGRDALALLSENPTPGFDVVLCDLMMPEITGEEVYTEVTRRWPDLARRFVFMTGGAFTPRGRRFLESVSAPVLEKPFDASQVRALVTERAAGSSRG